MSALLDSRLDAERLADALAHDTPPTSAMQRVREAIRRAPLRTHADLVALLSECVGRIDSFNRSTQGVDLGPVLDLLADAEHALEGVFFHPAGPRG